MGVSFPKESCAIAIKINILLMISKYASLIDMYVYLLFVQDLHGVIFTVGLVLDKNNSSKRPSTKSFHNFKVIELPVCLQNKTDTFRHNSGVKIFIFKSLTWLCLSHLAMNSSFALARNSLTKENYNWSFKLKYYRSYSLAGSSLLLTVFCCIWLFRLCITHFVENDGSSR